MMHQSPAINELSSLVLNILRSPSTGAIQFSGVTPPSYARRRRMPPQISPAGLASLMLGISLTLMLCGSLTFFIGFLLLPWVIGLVMVFYFVGLISSISLLWRTLLSYAAPPSSPPSSSPTLQNDIPAWKFL